MVNADHLAPTRLPSALSPLLRIPAFTNPLRRVAITVAGLAVVAGAAASPGLAQPPTTPEAAVPSAYAVAGHPDPTIGGGRAVVNARPAHVGSAAVAAQATLNARELAKVEAVAKMNVTPQAKAAAAAKAKAKARAEAAPVVRARAVAAARAKARAKAAAAAKRKAAAKARARAHARRVPSTRQLNPLGIPPGQYTFRPSRIQMKNAETIIWVGQRMHLPPRAWVIALATSLQESKLHNLGYLGVNNDHDSLGLFQQRPASGWGSPRQIQNPVYAAKKFYQALMGVPGWQHMPLTRAAQAVQVSAFPDRYAQWEKEATDLVVATYGHGPHAKLSASVH